MVADVVRQLRAGLLEDPGDAVLGPPGQARGAGLEVALSAAHRQAVEALLSQRPRHDTGAAHLADQPVVGGVVALDQRMAQQVAERDVQAVGPADAAGQRLVEDRAVLRQHHHRLVELELAVVHRLHHRQRHPELGDALLREPLVAGHRGRPALRHVADRDAHRLAIGGGEMVERGLELRGGRRRGLVRDRRRRPPGVGDLRLRHVGRAHPAAGESHGQQQRARCRQRLRTRPRAPPHA